MLDLPSRSARTATALLVAVGALQTGCARGNVGLPIDDADTADASVLDETAMTPDGNTCGSATDCGLLDRTDVADDTSGHGPDGTSTSDAAQDDASTSDVAQETGGHCASGQVQCSSGCVDLQTTATACGSCGRDCTQLPNVAAGSVSCTGGGCVLTDACAAGFGDCNGNASDGCEASLATSSHCGSCSMSCTGAQSCVPQGGSYACVSSCAAPRTACGGMCVDTSSDPANCGGCGVPCGGASGVCSGGQCEQVIVYAHTTTDLYTATLITGATTHAATFSFPNDVLDHSMADMAVSGAGVLYGSTFNGFYTVDPVSGVCSNGRDLSMISGSPNGMAVVPAGGVGAGSAEMLMVATTTGYLYRFDLTQYVLYPQGTFSGAETTSGDIAWLPGVGLVGTMLSGSTELLVTIDPMTATTTTIGPTGLMETWGLAAFGSNLMGFTGDGSTVSLDPTTGSASTLTTNASLLWYGAANTVY